MAEAKDPAIKLFGKTIPLPEIPAATTAAAENTAGCDGDSCSSTADGGPHDHNYVDDQEEPPSSTNNNLVEDMTEDTAGNERETDKVDDGNTHQVKQVGVSPQGSDKSTHIDLSVRATDNPDASSTVDEKGAAESLKSEEEKAETNVSQDKTPKKPDKILPCPRCNSMETKFCYFNNYNVNQPRHFCKNCQRYWTAGGTMRNVPVGAGRRKNKNSASHYRHVTIPEVLQHARPDIPNGIHPAMQTNGTVLTFGSDAPLCESMASILNLAENTMRNSGPSGFQKPEELKIPISFGARESEVNHLDGSNPKENASTSGSKEPVAQNCLPFPQMPCYPGAPWPYPWNSAQWSSPVVASPFCPKGGFPMPCYPAAAYWGCSIPGTWSIPLISQPIPQSHSSPSSSPNSPTLGKHPRDGNTLKSTDSEEKEPEESNSERSLWIPKTLRIDDPGEAAKSSLWSTLGIRSNEKPESISRVAGLFKAFQSKCDESKPDGETSSVLEANPAALTRSQTFQESS